MDKQRLVSSSRNDKGWAVASNNSCCRFHQLHIVSMTGQILMLAVKWNENPQPVLLEISVVLLLGNQPPGLPWGSLLHSPGLVEREALSLRYRS